MTFAESVLPIVHLPQFDGPQIHAHASIQNPSEQGEVGSGVVCLNLIVGCEDSRVQRRPEILQEIPTHIARALLGYRDSWLWTVALSNVAI
jgi:hypothetical protein